MARRQRIFGGFAVLCYLLHGGCLTATAQTTRATAHFVITYRGISDAKAAEIADEAEVAYRQISSLFDKGEYKFLNIHIYSFSPPIPFATRGHLHLSTQRIAENSYALTHELTHAMMPTRQTGYEYLLTEGLAVFVDEKFKPNNGDMPLYGGDSHKLVRTVVSGTHPLRNVAQSFTPIGQGALQRRAGYLVSGSFIRYLVEQYGVEKVTLLYEGGKFENLFGKPFDSLEAEWIGFLRDLPNWQPATDPDWQKKTDRTRRINTGAARQKPKRMFGARLLQIMLGNTISYPKKTGSSATTFEFYGHDGALERWSDDAPNDMTPSRWWIEDNDLVCRDSPSGRVGAHVCTYVNLEDGKLAWHRIDDGKAVSVKADHHLGRFGTAK